MSADLATKNNVGGFTHDGFEEVRKVFAGHLDSGQDVGASFCATKNGETVVDLWGGFADAARTRAWEKDTIVNVYSTTKTMTALTALLLADRGDLDFDAPVARYWPQFAANGKDRIKVSHLMSHSAGLSGWKEPITTEDLYDWEKVDRPARGPGPVTGNRGPRPATTRSPRATWWARWCGGSPGVRWVRSSARRSPSRWAPTSTSACRRPRIGGSPN